MSRIFSKDSFSCLANWAVAAKISPYFSAATRLLDQMQQVAPQPRGFFQVKRKSEARTAVGKLRGEFALSGMSPLKLVS